MAVVRLFWVAVPARWSAATSIVIDFAQFRTVRAAAAYPDTGMLFRGAESPGTCGVTVRHLDLLADLSWPVASTAS